MLSLLKAGFFQEKTQLKGFRDQRSTNVSVVVVSFAFHTQMALTKSQSGAQAIAGFFGFMILVILVLFDALVISVNLVAVVFFA